LKKTMRDARKRLGRAGEAIAADYLRRRGYAILEMNYRCPVGEVDIVARDGEWLAFVEVRTRRSRAFGTPEESITPAKQQKLIELAQTYLQEHDLSDVPWRIDVVAVEMDRRGKLQRINLIKNAVVAF
jgi:putative endonuclease